MSLELSANSDGQYPRLRLALKCDGDHGLLPIAEVFWGDWYPDIRSAAVKAGWTWKEAGGHRGPCCSKKKGPR
jgi:hypothetical protein